LDALQRSQDRLTEEMARHREEVPEGGRRAFAIGILSPSFTVDARESSFGRHLRHHVVVHHRHVAMHVDLIPDKLGQ
jgi:hypothetical protein